MLLAACLAIAASGSVQDAASETRVLARLPDELKIQTGSLRFARGGRQVAYIGDRDGKEVWVVGNSVGETFDSIAPPVFDASGMHVAFVVESVDKKDRSTFTLLLDGKKAATHPWIGTVVFSPSDSTPAYWTAERWEKLDGALEQPSMAILAFGKKKGSRFATIFQSFAPAFSADGRLVVSSGFKDEDDAVIVLDGKGKETLLRLGESVHVAVRPDGGEIMCTVVENSVPLDDEMGDEAATDVVTHVLARMPLGSKEKKPKPVILGSEYDSAGLAEYSPNGQHVAYRVSRGSKLGVAIDVQTDATCDFEMIGEVAIHPTEARAAFVGVKDCKFKGKTADGFHVIESVDELTEGGEWQVVDGATKSADFTKVASLCWSPDGSRLAYAAATADGWQVHVGDRASETFDDVAAVEWSADGKTVWFGARRQRDFVWAPFRPE
jgi:hypothetical protein